MLDDFEAFLQPKLLIRGLQGSKGCDIFTEPNVYAFCSYLVSLDFSLEREV